MVTFNTQRGVPYEPGAARAMREQDAILRARALDEIAKEEARLAKERRREELRAHGRKLDEEQRRLRRERRRHKG